jgi:hypothetical protein
VCKRERATKCVCLCFKANFEGKRDGWIGPSLQEFANRSILQKYFNWKKKQTISAILSELQIKRINKYTKTKISTFLESCHIFFMI